MPKFILLTFFLGLLVSLFYMPVPMEKLERKLEKEQLQLNQEVPSNMEAIASQNASRAFFYGTNHQKSVFYK